jgi:hypothetical protein
MLSCREVTRLVSDSLERNLGLRERMSLKMHLTMCSACSQFEQQMHMVRSALKTFATTDVAEPGAEDEGERR